MTTQLDWLASDANWKQVSLHTKSKWAAITDNDLEFLDRNKDALVAKVFERTGLLRDTAERQVDALLATLTTAADVEPVPALSIRFPAPGI